MLNKDQYKQVYNANKINEQINQLNYHLIKSNHLQNQQRKMRLVLRNIQCFSLNRKQNFFELNPIYPDYGEKDFDIYNVERHRVSVFDQYMPIKKRQQRVKLLIREQFLMRKYKLRQIQKENAKEEIDQDSGLPIGLNSTYDSFIIQYKKNKNKNQKIQNQFKTLLQTLIQKFKAKSQVQLIKLFRISLAHTRKNDLKQRIRGKLIEEAITRASAAKNDYFSDFFTDEKGKNEDSNAVGEMNEDELDEASFQEALKQIDEKIQKIQSDLKAKNPNSNADWDPVYGKKIQQVVFNNYNYDMNLKRGFKASKKTSEITDPKNQDEHIRRRINKLFFLRKIQYLKKDTAFSFDESELLISLRNKEKIINQLAHKYNDDEFMIVPDLKDIYNEIDLALSKVSIRLSSQLFAKNNDSQQTPEESKIQEKTFTNDSLIWDNLDVEKVFANDYYSKNNMDKQNISEKQLLHVSPSAGVQLSLNRVPFNLYRHSQCQIFHVFTKYKHMIMKDYVKDVTIDPKGEFNYFSLEEASNLLKRIKKPELDEKEKYYGHAKRKSSEAEVFVKHGTGMVIINGESISDYFADTYHRVEALKPLIFSETAGQYDLEFNVVGGGIHSQSQCCAYALAKALMKINPEYRKIFACFALDKHDPRVKEPKRIGLYSARVRPPYVRR